MTCSLFPMKGHIYLAPSGFLVDQKTYTDPLEQILSQGNGQESETLVRDVIEALEAAGNDMPHLLTCFWTLTTCQVLVLVS